MIFIIWKRKEKEIIYRETDIKKALLLISRLQEKDIEVYVGDRVYKNYNIENSND